MLPVTERLLLGQAIRECNFQWMWVNILQFIRAFTATSMLVASEKQQLQETEKRWLLIILARLLIC